MVRFGPIVQIINAPHLSFAIIGVGRCVVCCTRCDLNSFGLVYFSKFGFFVLSLIAVGHSDLREIQTVYCTASCGAVHCCLRCSYTILRMVLVRYLQFSKLPTATLVILNSNILRWVLIFKQCFSLGKVNK